LQLTVYLVPQPEITARIILAGNEHPCVTIRGRRGKTGVHSDRQHAAGAGGVINMHQFQSRRARHLPLVDYCRAVSREDRSVVRRFRTGEAAWLAFACCQVEKPDISLGIVPGVNKGQLAAVPVKGGRGQPRRAGPQQTGQFMGISGSLQPEFVTIVPPFNRSGPYAVC